MVARPEPNAPAKPKRLDGTDYQILEVCLRNPEASQQKVADAVGISVRTVNRRINKPAFQAELTARYAQCVDNTVKICRANAPFSVRRLLKIVKSTTSEDKDVIAAVRELNRIALESKLAITVDGNIGVKRVIDDSILQHLADDELAVLERIMERVTGGQDKGTVGA